MEYLPEASVAKKRQSEMPQAEKEDHQELTHLAFEPGIAARRISFSYRPFHGISPLNTVYSTAATRGASTEMAMIRK